MINIDALAAKASDRGSWKNGHFRPIFNHQTQFHHSIGNLLIIHGRVFIESLGISVIYEFHTGCGVMKIVVYFLLARSPLLRAVAIITKM